MVPRIKSYQPLADFQLLVSFDDGRKVRYDVADDIKTSADVALTLRCSSAVLGITSES